MIVSTTTNPKTNLSEFPQWQPATWDDYCKYRDDLNLENLRLFFNRNYLYTDMGNEGINHSKVVGLFAMLFFIWFDRFSEQTATYLGGCLIEKPKKQAASPDLVLYIGEGVPQWQEGEPRRIDLSKWRVPDLVGEIADPTLATDLDEKKQLYADLEIPEYWVIDILGKRVLGFRLDADGKYRQESEAISLLGLPISLLEMTLKRLDRETNISAAGWFARKIATLNVQ